MANSKNLLDHSHQLERATGCSTKAVLRPVPCFLALLLWCLAGCGYPEVSPKTYEISKALYSACNRQSEEHLSKVAELIESHLENGELTEREAKWLREIVQEAESGNWEAATLEARQLMEDQIDN